MYRSLILGRFRARTAILLLLVPLAVSCGGGGSSPVNADATFSISGTIHVASKTVADSDVNDPAAASASNNDSSTAQEIPSPVVVGGFADASTDPEDRYRTFLTSGQTITLNISDDPVINDLELFLYDDTQTLAGSSVGDTSAETITIPSDGVFDIVVQAASGASNYRLVVGQPLSPAANRNLSLEYEFVPDEVLVRYKAEVLIGKSLTDPVAASTGLMVMAGGEGPIRLLSMGKGAARTRILSALGIADSASSKSFARRVAPNDDEERALLRRRVETLQAVKALRRRSDVETADPNYIRRAFLAPPNDTYYAEQWSHPLINLPAAWETTMGVPTVIVAIVDTGVFMAHPDLSANLLSTGYDFVSNPLSSNDGDGIDPDPDDPGDSATPGQSSFHGTHVSGIVAAVTGNNEGIAGVAGGARIMPIRALGIGGGTSSDVIQSIRYAAGLSNVSGIILGPDEKADIINLSLGGPGYSSTEQSAYTDVRNAGVIVVAAAGNDGTSTLSYPASYDGVVSVSAVDRNKALASYSSFGAKVDVAAPGGVLSTDPANGILSTWVDDRTGTREKAYAWGEGTSMATPHVAGVAAILKSLDAGLTPGQFDSLLSSGALTEDLGPAGRDDSFGHGLIDAVKAVLASGAPVSPTLVVSPSSIDFGSFGRELTITASNVGDGPLTGTSASEDSGGWLSLNPLGGLGTYTVTVDRTGLSEGQYTATITFTSDANTVNVPVAMEVGTGSIADDAGLHHILLLDSTGQSVLRRLTASSVGGLYYYTFANLPPGTYTVVAGTDMDNDGDICDAGEACGGYPSASLPGPVEIMSTNVSGIDFVTEFGAGGGAIPLGGLTMSEVYTKISRELMPR